MSRTRTAQNVSPRDKEVLTTGDVARICHVAPRTVSKWFDSGKLRGYRIPGGRDRRIPVAQLVAFMRAHGMPLGELDGGLCRVLIMDAGVPDSVREALERSGRYEVFAAANEFEAGVLAQQATPHVIVLGVEKDVETASKICQNVKRNPDFVGAKLIGVGSGTRDAMLRRGFDAWLERPCTTADLATAIEDVTDLVG